MRFEGSIVIRRPSRLVWDFLGDISNISAWDRGVARAEAVGLSPPGVGFEFETFAYPKGSDTRGEWGKMSYRITQSDPARGCTIELTSRTGNARFVRSGVWRFRTEEAPEGSRVFSEVHFNLCAKYLFLAPVLFLIGRRAIRKDLESLKRVLEDARH
jgi:hypothetical protein